MCDFTKWKSVKSQIMKLSSFHTMKRHLIRTVATTHLSINYTGVGILIRTQNDNLPCSPQPFGHHPGPCKPHLLQSMQYYPYYTGSALSGTSSRHLCEPQDRLSSSRKVNLSEFAPRRRRYGVPALYLRIWKETQSRSFTLEFSRTSCVSHT